MLLHQPSMLIQLLPPMSTAPRQSHLTKVMFQPSRSISNKNLYRLLMISYLLYNNPIMVTKLARTSLSMHHLNHPMTRLLRITPFIRGILTHPRPMDTLPSLMPYSNPAPRSALPMNNFMSRNCHITAINLPTLSKEFKHRSLHLRHHWIPQPSHGAIPTATVISPQVIPNQHLNHVFARRLREP